MNKSVRRLALILGVAFAAIVGNLTYLQVARSTQLSNHPANRRLLIKEYSIQRGDIVVGKDLLARSVATEGRYKYLREYPAKGLYSFITGFYSFIYGRSGLESTYNDYLTGKLPAAFESSIVDELLGRPRRGHTLVLTLDQRLQSIAASKLGRQKGAVAAIDPTTGHVLALYAYPGYDPNPLSTHDLDGMRKAWTALNDDENKPLLSRATGERYPPGSTFKTVVVAAALEAGLSPETTFPNPSGFRLPLTDRILRNFGGGACPGGGGSITLANGFRVSCNSTFAQAALRVGAEKLAKMAGRFGLDRDLGFDLPLTRSCVKASPSGGCLDPSLDKPQTALTGIGQFGVRVSPLQMAVIAATIANGGRVPKPMVVDEVRDFSGAVVKRFEPSLSRPIYSARTAKIMKQLMVNVVEIGTGTNAQIEGVEVGGKTGTAQTGVDAEFPHTWFISFAPRIAVAVIVEHGGDLGNDATGGRVSAPIARALMEDWVKRTGGNR